MVTVVFSDIDSQVSRLSMLGLGTQSMTGLFEADRVQIEFRNIEVR